VSRRASRACILGASDGPTPRPLLTFAMRSREDSPPSAPLPDTPHSSLGQRSDLPCTGAQLIKHSPSAKGGLHGRVPARPDCATRPDRVRVLRSAHTFRAACRPHLAVTPLHFTGPSAPRTPGHGTFTPTHDRMHSTHAPGAVARRCVPRPLSGVVTQACRLCASRWPGHVRPWAWFER
jgi:hypothetical protein